MILQRLGILCIASCVSLSNLAMAKQCTKDDIEALMARENALMSSYLKSKRARAPEQIELKLFDKPVVIPNRFQMQMNEDDFRLGSGSIDFEYLGCTLKPFNTGIMIFGNRENCGFCDASSRKGAVTTTRELDAAQNLILKTSVIAETERTSYTFYDDKHFLIVDDPNLKLGDYIAQQLGATDDFIVEIE